MLTPKQACDLARVLPDVSVQDHFGSDAFRTPGGIFATVWHEKRTVNLRLTVEQQRRFVEIDGEGFVEIDNAWGRQGWTTASLEFLDREQFLTALQVAWQNSADNAAHKCSSQSNKPRTAKPQKKLQTKPQTKPKKARPAKPSKKR